MNTPDDALALLQAWLDLGWLREIDFSLARFFHDEAPDISPELLLASALVSHQLGRGHACLDVRATLADPHTALSLPPEDRPAPSAAVIRPHEVLAGCTPEDWCTRLAHADLVQDGPGNTPLVLQGHRLYLRRYWQYERQIEAALNARMTQSEAHAAQLAHTPFSEALHTLFPPQTDTASPAPDWQKIACALAARSAFCIITGGPGTGKTTTIVRLLALMQTLAMAAPEARPMRIRLAAPTGKAAVRLKHSIASAIDRLPPFVQHNIALKASIPADATTLHRLLGARPDSRLPRHDARNPLVLDILVVDEASMIDLEMMAALLNALPAHARLILLGDKDQLAAVEAGSVLGELCRHARQARYTPANTDWLHKATGTALPSELCTAQGRLLDQHIVMLRESRRFSAHSGIGRLAHAVNTGDLPVMHRVLSSKAEDLIVHRLNGIEDTRLETLLLGPIDAPSTQAHGIAAYLKLLHDSCPALDAPAVAFDQWALQLLAAHGRFQLLCAVRQGPCGVLELNSRIEQCLAQHGLIHLDAHWYLGRPVMQTRNDYRLNLMNGDIGLTLPYPRRDPLTQHLSWGRRVAFAKTDDSSGIHWVLPNRLPDAETVFAMTVHKSQGSEFEHCALLLPAERSPILTRELLYTGITRGKSWFSLICTGPTQLLDDIATRSTLRAGGLFAGLDSV